MPHLRDDVPDDPPVVVIEQNSAGVGAFLLGLGLGAAAALLLAPQAGTDTRRQLSRLSRRAQDAGDSARRQMQRAVEAGRVAATQARQDLERRIAETKAAYQASAGVTPGGYESVDDDGLEG